MKKQKNNQNGFAAFYITVLILAVVLVLAVNISVLTYGEQKIIKNVVKSSQAYYLAEGAAEDALLKLKKGMSWTSPYLLRIGNIWATTTISSMIGGTRTIVAQGNDGNRTRKVQIVYSLSTSQVSFYYGAQIGDGGMDMGNNSRVKGNVFSNGNVVAASGKGYIDNSIVVANNGNKIRGLVVGEDATVHTCENSEIAKTLTYVSGGSVVGCTAGESIKSRPNEIGPEDLPISQAQIDAWKSEAASGGIYGGNYIADNSSVSLGPIQIGTPADPKNLTVINGARLRVTGTIFVTGNINFSNNVIIELDQASYGSTGGVILANGKADIRNNAVLTGSGEIGSYILVLSTNNSLDPASPAISINNNAQGAIFYTSSGLIVISNNVRAREITGYKVKISNNAEVQYESGLANAGFSGGTGGSWKIIDWKEIE